MIQTAIQYKRSAKELALHKAIIQHLKLRAAKGVIFYHCPNGEPRSARTGAKLKAMGVLPGVSDIVLTLPPLGRTAYLELKGPNGRLMDSQIAFMTAARDAGALIGTASDIDQALSILESWGALKPDVPIRMEKAA